MIVKEASSITSSASLVKVFLTDNTDDLNSLLRFV